MVSRLTETEYTWRCFTALNGHGSLSRRPVNNPMPHLMLLKSNQRASIMPSLDISTAPRTMNGSLILVIPTL